MKCYLAITLNVNCVNPKQDFLKKKMFPIKR